MSNETEELRTESQFHPPMGDPGRSLFGEVTQLRGEVRQLSRAVCQLIDLLKEREAHIKP